MPRGGDGFTIERAGHTLLIVMDKVVRWRIDPASFGEAARAGVDRDGDRVEIWLRNAVFPGTTWPAGFRCLLRRTAGRWVMSLHSATGIALSADWLDWLEMHQPATGSWTPGTLHPFPGFSLSGQDRVPVTFTPDWALRVGGPVRAVVDRLPQELHASEWSIALNHPERLSADRAGHATTFSFLRGEADWPIVLERVSAQGWRLAHELEADLFDELRLEALDGGGAPVHNALLIQAERNLQQLLFFPGGGLFDSLGEPFALRLRAPRIAMALSGKGEESALLAELNHEVQWAHTSSLSVAFAGASANSSFTLLDDGNGSCCPEVKPLVKAVQCPGDQDCTIKLNFDEPRPTPLNWAKAPDGILSGLHILGDEHRLSFDLSCGDVLSVIRPTDMLKLDFEFQNVRLASGSTPRIEGANPADQKRKFAAAPPEVGETELLPSLIAPTTPPGPAQDSCGDGKCLPSSHRDQNQKTLPNCPQLLCAPNGKPRVTVTFPPQHIQEQAFFHTDDPFDKAKPAQGGQPAQPKTLKLGPVEKKKYGQGPNQDIGFLDPDAAAPDKVVQPPEQPNKVPADAILSGESNLVFDLDLPHDGIPFHLENLLDWSWWTPAISTTARQNGDASPAELAADFNKQPDKSSTTSIELPYRLFLSPHQNSAWAHAKAPVAGKSTAVELWHTRLAVKNGNAPDETNAKDRTARAIYSPDLTPQQVQGTKDLVPHQGSSNVSEPRYALDMRDREEIVTLMSDFSIAKPDKYLPQPMQLDHLMLTSLGGYLKGIGDWEPPEINFPNDVVRVLTVEQWKQITTLGRDQYVRVVYKGYLAPFSHRASLIKVTERKFYPVDGLVYAMLHQRMYIVVHQPRRDFPLYRQANGGRQFPFLRVDALTTVTPDLDDPNNSVPPGTTGVSQSLFWPTVNGNPFPFRFRFWDMENNISEASLPLVFGDASVSQSSDLVNGCPAMIKLYNAGSSPAANDPEDKFRCTNFQNQSIAFAPPGKPGDTRYDAADICWKIVLDDGLSGATDDTVANDLYEHNLPLFYPVVDLARVISASIQRITGEATPRLVRFFPAYVTSGFDPVQNPGEVVLEIIDPNPLVLQYGGGSGKTDQAGGLSSPDIRVVGFSRKSGAVGGTPSANGGAQSSLQVYSKGTFSPADFFGGLTSAKLLGAVKLSDILQPLLGGLDSNLGDAPRMVEQGLVDFANGGVKVVNDAEDQAITLIGQIQSSQVDSPLGKVANPLATRLAAQTQAVLDAKSVRDQTSPGDTLDLALAHVALIQAIVVYGDALKSQLQDPESLLSEAAVDLLTGMVNGTIGTEFVDFTNALAGLFSGLQGTILNTLLTSAQGLLIFLAALSKVLVGDAAAKPAVLPTAVADPLPVPIGDELKSLVNRSAIELRLLAPEIFALLDLVPVAQDLVNNINQMKSLTTTNNAFDASKVLLNLPGIATALSQSGKDLLALQQGLGLLSLTVKLPNLPVLAPTLATTAQNIQTTLVAMWSSVLFYTGADPLVLKAQIDAQSAAVAAVDALNSACVVFAAQCELQDGQQVLQNLRQIQRTFDQLTILKGAVVSSPNASDPKLICRWLQRLQQLQRQILESTLAIQKVAAAALALTPPAAKQSAAAALLYALQGGATSQKGLLRLLTCMDALAQTASPAQMLETLVGPAATIVQGALGTQLAALQTSLSAARTTVNAGVPPPLQAYAASAVALAAVNANPASTPAQKQAAQQAVQTAVSGLVQSFSSNSGLYDQFAAAQLQLYDLSVRYQNCVSSVMSWTLFVTEHLADDALVKLLDLYNAVNAAAQPLQTALDVISDKGKALYAFVQARSDLTPLFGTVFAPLNSLPRPAAGAPITELWDDTRSVMAAGATVVSNVQNRARLAVSEVESLARSKSLAVIIAQLPIPSKVSFSYTWHPKIKSFEPVFLLDSGADFSITAKFEEDALNPGPPAYNITAQLTEFSINLIGNPSFVILSVSKLVFTSSSGNKPDCKMTIKSVNFGEAMSFAQKLASLLNPQNGPFIEFAGGGIRAGFRFHIPTITMGAFTMMQLALEVAIQLSFDGSPVRCQIGISDQTHPFLLSAGIYGGGGFLQLALGLDGVELMQGALEFGVVAAISIGPLEGSGYVVAGIYFRIGGNNALVCGFVHAHGHMDIFGLISLDVDVYVALCYSNGVVQGVATFSVSVTILFFHEDFSLQASYQFSGSSQGSSSGGLDDDGNSFLHLPNNNSAVLYADDSEHRETFISPQDWAEHFAAFAA
jgi:hypothetical protein